MQDTNGDRDTNMNTDTSTRTNTPPDFDPAADERRVLAHDLARALAGIQRASRRHLRRHLALEPLSGAEVELLRLVALSPGIGVTAAARELSLAGNSVSTLVNQLVAKAYLRREPSPTDRRAAVLTATDAGTERLDRWADERVRLFAEKLGRLDPDELTALRAALPVLRRIADGLTASASGSASDPESGPQD